MSKLTKVIKRTEEWLKNQKICWATNDSNGLASDIQRLIDTARAATLAVEMLQKAQRYDLAMEGVGEPMVHSDNGNYVDVSDVMKTIKILQEGQQ